MFLFWLSGTYRIKAFCAPQCTLAGRRLGMHKELGGISWPQLTKGAFQTIWHHAQHVELREEGGREGCSEGWSLSSQVTIRCDGVWLSWRWLNTHQVGVSEQLSYQVGLNNTGLWCMYRICVCANLELILNLPTDYFYLLGCWIQQPAIPHVQVSALLNAVGMNKWPKIWYLLSYRLLGFLNEGFFLVQGRLADTWGPPSLCWWLLKDLYRGK